MAWLRKVFLSGYLMLALSGAAYALPPQAEMDRLILAAQAALSESNFESAKSYLERVEPLELEPPAEFYRLQGEVMFNSREWDKSQLGFERFIGMAGRDSEHYKQVLGRLTDIEQAKELERTQQQIREENIAISAGNDERVKLIENQKGEAYDRQVQALFLDEDLVQSLVTHLNSLLRSYVYIEGKIKNYEKNNRIDYSVSVNKEGVIMLTSRDVTQTRSGQKAAMNVAYLNAFGVNPSVGFRCSKVIDSCYVKHPVNQSDWIRVAYDEAGADDIATALMRLLKALQRG